MVKIKKPAPKGNKGIDNFLVDLMTELRQANFMLFSIAQSLSNPDNIDTPDACKIVLDDLKAKYDNIVFGPLKEDEDK